MAAGSHIGWPKITFDIISRHFRSTFLFCWNFLQNGHRRPFWMTENHFQSHFSPFQINKQLFFTKWPPAAILDGRKSLSIAFLAISDQYAAFFFFLNLYKMAVIISSQNVRQRPFWFIRFAPKSIGFFHSRSSMVVSNMNLIRALVSQLREIQALVCGGCGGGGARPKP